MAKGLPSVRSAERRVGFYGCQVRGRGRLVRIEEAEPDIGKDPPRAVLADCPVCGVEHIIGVAWRAATELDGEPELWV